MIETVVPVINQYLLPRINATIVAKPINDRLAKKNRWQIVWCLPPSLSRVTKVLAIPVNCVATRVQKRAEESPPIINVLLQIPFWVKFRLTHVTCRWCLFSWARYRPTQAWLKNCVTSLNNRVSRTTSLTFWQHHVAGEERWVGVSAIRVPQAEKMGRGGRNLHPYGDSFVCFGGGICVNLTIAGLAG